MSASPSPATVWAADVPGWVSAAAVVGALAGLGWVALTQAATPENPPPDDSPEDPDEQDHPASDWERSQSGAAR